MPGPYLRVASMAQVATLLAIFLMVILLTSFEAENLIFGEAVPSSLGSYQIMYVVFGMVICLLIGYMYFPHSILEAIRIKYYYPVALLVILCPDIHVWCVGRFLLFLPGFSWLRNLAIRLPDCLFFCQCDHNIWLALLVRRLINRIDNRGH